MRRTLEDVFNEIDSKEATLIRKTLVFVSPISDNLEYRVAYFNSASEASLWEDHLKSCYERVGTVYHVYTDYREMK